MADEESLAAAAANGDIPSDLAGYAASLGLTEQDLQEFREVFNLVDTDRGRSISTEELGSLMETLGIKTSNEELRLMVSEIDENGNGEIDFHEFVQVMSRKVHADYTIHEVKRAFQMFAGDDAPDGTIFIRDLEKALTTYGREKLSEDDARALCAQLETSDGLFSGLRLRTCRRLLGRPLTVVRVLYGSDGGTARNCAVKVCETLRKVNGPTAVVPLLTCARDYCFDQLFLESHVVVCVSTAQGGTFPQNSALFASLLEDAANDHRVSKNSLSKLRAAVVGFGDDNYPPETFCAPAKQTDEWLTKLGARKMAPLLLVSDSKELEPQVHRCVGQVVKGVVKSVHGSDISEAKVERRSTEGGEGEEGESDSSSSASEGDDDAAAAANIEDVADGTCSSKPEMLTTRHRQNLQKEGYKLIGSHSAVKLCRWTKHHIRGRGGCYKHTFYGISSMNCMEATPSLACANKCVFCWRHHKNPVGREWRWAMDPAPQIAQEAIRLHLDMIKQLKGVPGVTTEKFDAAGTVKHCALSLVGEPIMYPEINLLLGELHSRGISSFLVTNAQFPEAIRALVPVTQLYVSIDAADKDSLKKVDRPLFQDFWERFIDSLRALKAKRQRTVYRLTLVKKYNMGSEEDLKVLRDYADLIALGEPDLVEIKGVTFAGSSKAGGGGDGLTMENVPWHEEVVEFATQILGARSDIEAKYSISCEHAHSNSVLIANNKFHIDGQWHTWIDYPRFTELVQTGKPFTSLDYCAPTPDWAVYGAEEAGFDPAETKHKGRSRADRETRKKQLEAAAAAAATAATNGNSGA